MAHPPCTGNALLESLCNEGRLDRSLNVLFQMDTPPSTETYLSLLTACYKNKALSQAKQVQAHLAQRTQYLSGRLGDYLVMTLAKCGAVEDALVLARELPCRSVFSWTALISAYVERGQGREALKLHKSMKEDGVEPSHYTFVSLLKACGSISDLGGVRMLHNDARQMGLAADFYICTTLISVYGKCGVIEEAESIFGVLSRRDVVAWNAMLAAYVDQGLADKALQLFRQMDVEGVSIDQLMFIIALQACGILAEKEGGRLSKSASLEIALALHANARKKGFCSGAFMFTTLVNTYSKCGSTIYAENVFTTVWAQCNSVTWNVMISAYFEHNQERKSLQLYRHMHEEGVMTNEYTFAIALQACGAIAEKEEYFIVDGLPIKLVALKLGKALHADAQRMKFDSDIFVCNTLIRIYGKCGAISEAEDAFCNLFNRDIVSCNALLSAYVEHGEGEKALLLYKQMQEELVSPDQLTFVMATQGCGKLAEKEESRVIEGPPIKLMSLEIGLTLHDDIRRRNFASDVVVGDSLVRMYSNCGSIAHAEDVFVTLGSQNDVRSWTSMLSAYVDQGHGETALQLFRQMYKEGVTPDHHTFVMALHTCGSLAEKEEAVFSNGHPTKVMTLEIGKAIHANARRLGYAFNIFVSNTLVSMYGKCGDIAQAVDIFYAMPHRDQVSWNAILSAYSACGEQGDKVLQLYMQMHVENFSPDQLTFVIALQACSSLSELKEANGEWVMRALASKIGQALRSDAEVKGFGSDLLINNTLVSMYGKCGNLQEAETVFRAMCQRDTVSWTAMLSVYVEQGEGEKVLDFYREMRKEVSILDDVTLVYILQTCGNIGSLEICRQHHFAISSAGYDFDISLASTLVHTYGNCASLMDSCDTFDRLHQPDLATWNAYIANHVGGGGDCKASMHLFEELHLVGNEPDEISFIAVLSACSHAGLASQGFENYDYMVRECGFYPDLKHYSIMVDLLGRSGDFKRVKSLLKRMPMQADSTMWMCLLGACCIHGNLDFGEHAFNLAVSSHPKESAAYVLMSNIYANAGLQDLKRELGISKAERAAWNLET